MSTTPSKSFGAQRALKAHLLRGSGGLQAEIQDVRNDAEDGFQAMENRTGFPELDLHDLTGGGIAAAVASDFTLVGRNLLQGQTFDEVHITEGTVDLLIAALKPGESGIRVKFETGAGALAVDLTDGLLTITLPVAGQDTVDNIATIINADASNCNGHVRADMVAGTGVNITQAAQGTAEIPLAGGEGDYANNKVMVGGLEALPQNETGTASTAKWTDTGVLATSQVVGGAGDHAQVTVESNGVRTQPLSVVLT